MTDPPHRPRSVDDQRIEDLIAEVRSLRDAESIRSLQATFWRLCDGDLGDGPTHDAEAIADLFTEDGSWRVLPVEHRGAVLPETSAAGRAELLEWFRRASEAMPFCVHFGLAPSITVEADLAHGSWRVLGASSTADGRALWAGAGYEVDYRRTRAGWRISSIVVTRAFKTPFDRGWAVQRFA